MQRLNRPCTAELNLNIWCLQPNKFTIHKVSILNMYKHIKERKVFKVKINGSSEFINQDSH